MCIGWLAESSESRSVIDPVDRINLTPLDVRIHSYGWFILIFSWLFNCHFIQILDQPQTLGWWRNSLVKSWHTGFLFVWLFHAKQLLGMNFANLRFFLQLIWSSFGLSLSSILISGPPIWFPQIDWLPRRLATNSRLADRQRFRFPSLSPLFQFFITLHG